ncbi:Glycosyl transferase group 1 [Methylorubrum extorquens]|uniref:Glycosyl transferase group 1 n=1 Tax=Methylorubrum extorquens TaxID=408 RepID=A0A2N9ALK7_METEX|nr:Glycosyl transferase group 1 [Methylorubrum extorquens]
MSQRARLRLLVVGMSNSPHLHRWVSMVARPDVAIVVFPSLSFPVNLPEGFRLIDLADVTEDLEPGIFLLTHTESRREEDTLEDRDWGYVPFSHSFVPPHMLSTPAALLRCIDRLRPHLLHGMETQIAGYLCAEAARRAANFPTWIQSTWGSDLFLFRKLEGHPERLKKVFGRVQIHLADCARDRPIARQFGYQGPDMPIVPSSGGVSIDDMRRFGGTPPSKRTRILVKGYHNWAGRALLGLSALTLVRDELKGFGIDILAAGPRVRAWAQQMSATLGMEVRALDYMADHTDALRRLGEARLVIGLGISDGLSTTVLEAMSVGTFPVQSCTSCCDEWIQDGQTGLIVPPSDTRAIANAIVRAATDDELVDTAARRNLETVSRRWSTPANRVMAWRIYDQALGKTAASRV